MRRGDSSTSAHRLGAPWVRVFPDRFVPSEPREVTIARVGGNLAELGWFARGSGVGVLVESHGEFTDSASLEALMKAAGHAPGVGLVWDTHHTVSAGKEKPADTWARLGRWVHHTHIKDSTPGEKEVTYVLTGQGTIGVRDVVMALAAGGYKGYYGFEWEKQWHPDIAEPEVAFPHYAEVMTQVARRKPAWPPASAGRQARIRQLMVDPPPADRGPPRTEAARRPGKGAADARLHEVGHAVSRRARHRRCARPAGWSSPPIRSPRSRTGATRCWRSGGTRGFAKQRYAALLLTGERRYRDYQTLAALPLYEELIVTGAWWDYVDPIASKRIGPVAAAIPRPHAHDHAGVEPLDGHVEAAHGDPVPAVVQGRHRPVVCSTTASSPISATRSSSSARRSAGPCASMRGPTRRSAALRDDEQGPPEPAERAGGAEERRTPNSQTFQLPIVLTGGLQGFLGRWALEFGSLTPSRSAGRLVCCRALVCRALVLTFDKKTASLLSTSDTSNGRPVNAISNRSLSRGGPVRSLWVMTVTTIVAGFTAAVVHAQQAPQEALDGLDPVLLIQGKEVAGKPGLTVVRGRFEYRLLVGRDQGHV